MYILNIEISESSLYTRVKYIISRCINTYIYNELHSFRDIYLMQKHFVFQTKENLTRTTREKKNKSEIVIVYFYASNNLVVEKLVHKNCLCTYASFMFYIIYLLYNKVSQFFQQL